jgi:hypothetical protein
MKLDANETLPTNIAGRDACDPAPVEFVAQNLDVTHQNTPHIAVASAPTIVDNDRQKGDIPGTNVIHKRCRGGSLSSPVIQYRQWKAATAIKKTNPVGWQAGCWVAQQKGRSSPVLFNNHR